ncbi:MAG: AAA family ATPase [Bryobacteraceae bacterium]
MTSIAFFNNKGGVGKTTLVYHLAHMFARMGYRALAVDLDPQANLTSAFFDDDLLQQIWNPDVWGQTVMKWIDPVLEGTGDIGEPVAVQTAGNLAVLAGDLGLSRFEDRLSRAWLEGFGGDPAALRATSAFHRLIQKAAAKHTFDLVLIDVGPNLGAINRAALLSADYLVVPLAADMFSLQGLRNLGPTLRGWREDWQGTVLRRATVSFPLPSGRMIPAGYVILQHAVRLDRPVRAYERWMARIPEFFHKYVLDAALPLGDDTYRLGTLRNYRSLMPMAQEARKPMFDLKAADGAIGSHAALVQTCAEDFQRLAESIGSACGLTKPVS